MNWEALITTFKLALTTSVILMLIALPLSYWVAFSKWRWKFLVEAVVALPLVLPPTVLGFYVLVALGPQSPLGRFSLPFTFGGLVVASVVYSLPFAVQPIAAAFGAVERKYIEASWMLGVSNLETFFRVIVRSEEHTSELQSLAYLVCRLLLEKKKQKSNSRTN